MKVITIFIVLFVSNLIIAQTGTISGIVIDSETKEPLPGANIIINEIENLGAATNINGKFSFDVPVGSYSLKASIIGYTPAVKTDIIIKTNSDFYIEIQLAPTTLEMDEITIHADYFDKAMIENNISALSLAPEEIKRSPGSMMDFQRILQAMAGVSFSNDQNNELLVRGGSPNENLTVFDGMELHSTNHYPNEYNSGGPINMINTELIQELQFSTGGFISKYGNKLSSVMQITGREGTRNKSLVGEFNLSMAGIGGIAEGGINNGKGSWIISARKSYLEWIVGSIGLTSVPKYYDLQYKAVYDLNKNHKISITGIYGNDRIDIEGETDKVYPEKANLIDSIDVQQVNVKQNQWANGILLKSIWSNKFYSQIGIYANNYHNDVFVAGKYIERQFNNLGEVASSNTISERNLYKVYSDNTEAAFKATFAYNFSKKNKIEFGGQIKFGKFYEDISLDGDTTSYDLNHNGYIDSVVIEPPVHVIYDYKLFDNHKAYFFINENFKLFNDRLIINAGVRYDYFTYSKQGNISPRFSFSYFIIPALTSLNFAYGEFYQTQAYPYYADKYETNINRNLKNSHARHFVAGIEHIIDEGLKVSLEGYYKKYTDLPVSEQYIHYHEPAFRSEKYLSIGRQEVYGTELLIQQKLVKDYYGTLAFSRMWTKYFDPRIGYEGNTYVSYYDYPYVVTIILGKRFHGLRNKLDNMPAIIKYPSYILPISDDMEMSFRWRYASGRPYTAKRYSQNAHNRVGAQTWTDGIWYNTGDYNVERYPAYHRLDFGMSSRFNFNTWNLVIYLSVQNIYNRKNIVAYQYNSDGTIDNIYQYEVLPVVGLEIEF